MFDRAEIIDKAFLACVETQQFPECAMLATPQKTELPAHTLVDIFDTQLMSRHLDLMARRSKGKTYYSIGSSGHEGLAAMAIATRPTDMAFLHYRDAAFLIQRFKQIDGQTPLYNMALSFCAAADDPISGGRHKVLGSVSACVPPQTSTIASHLPKAVGAAHSIALARKSKHAGHPLPDDSIILCSFGDASSNHSTAQGAINAACWASYQGAPMPLVFVCEDNGIGISVPTPKGWIAENFSRRPGLAYISCDTRNIEQASDAFSQAVRYARIQRKPVFVHASTVRLMGHAGADIEATYEPLETITKTEAFDPLLVTAHTLITRGILSGADIAQRYRTMADRVARVSTLAIEKPKLSTADQVKASLIPPVLNTPSPKPASVKTRALYLPKEALNVKKSVPLVKNLNYALADILHHYPQTVLFGEDVGRKGGVYGVTAGLQKQFGRARVFDTLLDEQSILGQAIGMAQNGFIPIPEIQFLAYLHNAEDQIRGEAATLPFFSNGHYTNPMVIRIAGLGYQRGFGGHFHNDNSFAVLRDIPGLILACPSNGHDAALMMREAVRLAHQEQRIVVFLEPIALYGTADLHDDGDGGWLSPYPKMTDTLSYGAPGMTGDGKDIAIITYGNGTYLSQKAEKILSTEHKIKSRIIDIRWLHPLPVEAIHHLANDCDTMLIVDECRQTGSISEQIITGLTESGVNKAISRVTAHDSFIPLGPAAYSVLPSVDDIIGAALSLTGGETLTHKGLAS